MKYAATMVASRALEEDARFDVPEFIRAILSARIIEDLPDNMVVGEEVSFERIPEWFTYSEDGPWWRRPLERLGVLDKRQVQVFVANYRLTVEAVEV